MFLSLSVFVFIGSQPFFIPLPEQHNRKKEKHPLISYRPFSSCLEPPSQSEAKCESIDKKMILYSHATATHFHKKGFALRESSFNMTRGGGGMRILKLEA